jgi:PAS domain S-box-containing protein
VVGLEGGADGYLVQPVDPDVLVATVKSLLRLRWAEESQTRYAAILEATTDFVGIADNGGRVISVNRAGRRMVGICEDDDVSSLALADYHPEWARKIVLEQGFPSAVRDGAWSGETALLSRDGREIPVSQVIIAHKGQSEEVEYFSTIARDVTERKRAEERLRQSEERLRRAIEIETVGVIFFKTDGSITNANDAFLRMSGYSREDLVEGLVRWDKMTPPEWMPQSLKAIEEFRSTGRTVPYEKEYVRKDGSRWWALFAATRLDEEEGVEFIIDITQSKQAEEAVRESEERYRAFFETAAVGAAEADLVTGRFVRVNDNLCRFLGYSRDELLTMTFFQVTHPDDRARNSEGVARLVRGEIREYVTEKRYLRKDGEIVWAQLAVALVRDRDGRPLHSVAITQDITDRKRVEEALAREVRAKSDFLADVSHELRTPLTVIRGNAEVGLQLRRECVHADHLEEIVEESSMMSRMVEDLLFLARSDSDSLPLDLQTVPAEELRGGLARRAEALARKHGAFLQTALSGKGRLRCDAQRINQAVLVLVDNAVKYGLPGEPVRLSSSTRQGELLIEVSDRGPGIPSEEMARIFERFYRGESTLEERGSGLGLAIARTIAGAHGGSLEAESRVGEGTHMFLHLPLADGP